MTHEAILLLQQIDQTSKLPDPEGGDCPRCGSGWTYWINAPAVGEIGSGPAYFYCWYCENEWSIDPSDEEQED